MGTIAFFDNTTVNDKVQLEILPALQDSGIMCLLVYVESITTRKPLFELRLDTLSAVDEFEGYVINACSAFREARNRITSQS